MAITAIILAAGTGSRLDPIARDVPKPLLDIGGRPAISYTINFVRAIGTDRIIVVGGFRYEKIKHAVHALDPAIEIVENTKYLLGNLYSLKTGLDQVGDSGFLLTNADHIYKRDIADKIKKQCGDKILAFTDTDRTLGDDDMKVSVRSNGAVLKHISKKLTDYTHGYVGLTYCPPQLLPEYRKAVQEVLEREPSQRAVAENVLQYITDNTPLDVHLGDISGSLWHEVDFPHELNTAQEAVGQKPEEYL